MKKTINKRDNELSSRIKYESENPTVSARIPRKDYDALKLILDKSKLSLSDVLKSIAAGSEILAVAVEKVRQSSFEEAKKLLGVSYPCSNCGKPLLITSPEEKTAARRCMVEYGWRHMHCPETKSKL